MSGLVDMYTHILFYNTDKTRRMPSGLAVGSRLVLSTLLYLHGTLCMIQSVTKSNNYLHTAAVYKSCAYSEYRTECKKKCHACSRGAMLYDHMEAF